MKNSISDIIISRIHLKKMENWAKVKSLTLGIERWNELKDELLRSSAIYPYFGIYKYEFHGLPVKVSYKRPRLIQVNMDVKRRKRKIFQNEFITIDYMHTLKPIDYTWDYDAMGKMYQELKDLSKKYPISFLTSAQ